MVELLNPIAILAQLLVIRLIPHAQFFSDVVFVVIISTIIYTSVMTLIDSRMEKILPVSEKFLRTFKYFRAYNIIRGDSMAAKKKRAAKRKR